MSPSVSVRLLLTQSDERLVGYARAGHERAFEALVERYRRQLHRYCRRLLLSDERAEDALQQALLQAWVALRGGAEVHDLRPWLYRIVHNAAVNALRVSGYDYCTLNESLSGADAPQADLDRRIAVREALAGLAALPEMQREALLRTAVEGRSHQQVASDLGVSEPALRGLVYRARTALRTAAGAIVPPPLVSWALETSTRSTPVLEQVPGLSGGGGAAGLAALIVKGSTVAVTAGVLAGGIVAAHDHKGRAHVALAHPSARTSDTKRNVSLASGAEAPMRPAAFTQLSHDSHIGPEATSARSKRASGRLGHWRLSAGVHPSHTLAPEPTWTPRRHDNDQRDEEPRPVFGPHDRHRADSGGFSSRDGHDKGSASTGSHDHDGDSGASGSESGDHEQRHSGGTSRDGGTSGGSGGKDGSADTSGQTSGDETSSSKDGSGETSGDSGDSRQSQRTSGDGAATGATTGARGSKDGAVG